MNIKKLETQDFSIDNGEGKEHFVQITPFLGRKGIKIKIRLAKLLAPLMNADPKNIDMAVVTQAITSNLDEDNILSLVERLLSETVVDSKPLSVRDNFDILFAAEYEALFDIIKLVLEVNYKGFLAKIGITLTPEDKTADETEVNLTPDSRLN